MKYLKIIALAVLVTGCAPSGYSKYYTPYLDAKTTPDLEVLEPEDEPKIFGSNDFKNDINVLISKRYKVLGVSSFNGQYEDKSNIIAQAQSVGATIVLVKAEYTNTLTTNSTLFLPDNKTTYHSGTGSANTTYSSPYSGYLGSSNTNATYSGTSTTYGKKAVPITSHQQRYDQEAVFLVKSTKKLKFGMGTRDLTPELRMQIERNSGAEIMGTIEESPSFYANVLKGDILIDIDGVMVKNSKHAFELMTNVNPEASSSVLTIIRKGKEKKITVKF